MTEHFIHRLQEVCARAPHAAAVVYDDQLTVSYGQLWAEANCVADQLVERGLRSGEFVGIYVEKSAEYVVGLVAVWLAGGAFVPLDPCLPTLRLEHMARTADIRFVLCAPGRMASWASPPVSSMAIERAGRFGVTPVERFLSATTTAYAIFTSGSTGRPKAVVVTHRGLVNLLDAQIEAFTLNGDSQVLWLLSLSFDASISDIGTCLLAGAALHIESSLRSHSAAALIEALRVRKITHVDVPPSILASLDVEQAPRTLSTVVIGGEVCQESVVRAWSARTRVVNVYGPTEATICSSLSVCGPRWDRPLIGRPLPHVDYLISGDSRQPASVGEIGELFIGGIGVAKEYLGDPELTDQKFVTLNDCRFFRTGDLVKLHGDGEIEFVGRVDRQFKARGVLVAPEEIEALLHEHNAIREAAVVPHHRRGRNRIVAYYVGAVRPAALRHYLSDVLPPNLVPDVLISLESLPRVASGKVDFATLGETVCDSGTGESPETEIERALARVWMRVLQVEPIGVDSHFFELGGDSLSVVELVVAAESEGVFLTAEQVYACPRLGTLAETVERTPDANTRVTCDALRADPVFSIDWSRFSETTGTRGAHDRAHYLVTGATGFLGGEVLRYLLERTPATITCLIRADTSVAARDRLAALQVSPTQGARLVALRGDLRVPYFGVRKTQWQDLVDHIDAVYHCGADVNLVKPASELRDTNVVGTKWVLELCRRGKPKSLHYASTLSVFVGSDHSTGVFRETDCIDSVGALYGGYAQSKWVAERLVRQAAEVLGDVSIYRFGLLTGDSKSGQAPSTDWLSLMVRGLVQVGAVPDGGATHARFDITPVDYGAAAMVELSLRVRDEGDEKSRTFHIAGSGGAGIAELSDALCRAGFAMPIEPAEAWLERALAVQLEPTVAAAVLGARRLLPSRHTGNRACDVFQATHAMFDTSHADQALLGSGVCRPRLTQGLLDMYIRRMLRDVRP